MQKIAIVYGSSGGNTKEIANRIVKKLTGNEVTLLDVEKLKEGDLDAYPVLILGTSTWGLGDLQDDWDDHLPTLKKSNLEGKTVAFFGLGDSSSYPDTFVDGMGLLYQAVKDKGIKLIGQFPVDGYDFDESQAVVDGHLVGVALDVDNEDDKTEERLGSWVESVLKSI